MPIDTAKIEAHSSSYLDGYLRLSEKYALLEPIVFDHPVVDMLGKKHFYYGLETLQLTLYMSCAQDIAKCIFDTDVRAPSLFNIVRVLRDSAVRAQLRSKFTVWVIPKNKEDEDPFLAEALQKIELREQAERGKQFDTYIEELFRLYEELIEMPQAKSFLTIRDKVTAHTEIRMHEEVYSPISIASLGLKWGDIKFCIDKMQRTVELSGLIVRNTSFSWDSFQDQIKRHISGMWQGLSRVS